MENNLDIKQELQQELCGLQQHIEHHSTFHSDVWRRAVERHAKHLFNRNLFYSIVLAVGAAFVTFLHFAEGILDLWLVVAFDFFMALIIVSGILTTFNLIRPLTGSRDGLQSLRETVNNCTDSSRRGNRIIQILGGILIVAIIVYQFNRGTFDGLITLFSTVPTGLLVGFLVNRREKKKYRELGDEVDELLKEE